jgi:hypothetical protein
MIATRTCEACHGALACEDVTSGRPGAPDLGRPRGGSPAAAHRHAEVGYDVPAAGARAPIRRLEARWRALPDPTPGAPGDLQPRGGRVWPPRHAELPVGCARTSRGPEVCMGPTPTQGAGMGRHRHRLRRGPLRHRPGSGAPTRGLPRRTQHPRHHHRARSRPCSAELMAAAHPQWAVDQLRELPPAAGRAAR